MYHKSSEIKVSLLRRIKNPARRVDEKESVKDKKWRRRKFSSSTSAQEVPKQFLLGLIFFLGYN